MTTFADAVNSQFQKPVQGVTYGGTQVWGILSIEITRAYDQQVAECRIIVGQPFGWKPDMLSELKVYEGYDGVGGLATFTGYVDDVKKGATPNTWEISARDKLKRAAETWLDDTGVTYTDTQAETAVA